MITSVLLAALLAASVLPSSETSDKTDAIATVQKLFNGMAAHDAAMIRSTVLPDARFYSVRADAPPSSTPAEDFANHIAAFKGDLLERFTRQPTVSLRGQMAQVWGEYEFLRDGKFGHCGVDSVSLFKTADGWKIASIAYTSETTNCPGH
jgi:hypothetical protein